MTPTTKAPQCGQVLQRDIALTRQASQERMGAEERAARERMNNLKIDTDRQLFNAESALRVQTGQGI